MKYKPTDGRTATAVFPGSKCSSTTRSVEESRRDDRAAAGRPADEMPVGILDVRRLHALEPRLAIQSVSRAGRAAAIDANDGVVHRRPVRPELHRAHELRRRHVERHDDIAVHVARPAPSGVEGSRCERIGARHGDDEIGLAELPARGPGSRLRRLGGISLRRSAGSPAPDRRDVPLLQPAFAGKGRSAARRQPGRHVTRLDSVRNPGGAPLRIVVAHQRERDRLAGPVTGLAVREKDRGDVVVEGRRGARAPGDCAPRYQKNELTWAHRPAPASGAGSEWRR